MSKESLNVAIIGCGTVGLATARLLTTFRAETTQRSGINVHLKTIVVRKPRPDIPRELQPLLSTDMDAIFDDPDIDCIVELIGSPEAAFSLVKRALMADKHVVTANKALLALHGNELWGLARTRKKCIGFEASCGGGLPIIRSLIDGLLANQIEGIFGILNGTCNYILTAMATQRISYQEALDAAVKGGVAEADPSLDINGTDTAHKIAIISSLAFNLKVNFSTISIQGIDDIDIQDIQIAKTLGYEIKLVAAAYRVDTEIAIWVRPVLLPEQHCLAWVQETFNAVSVYGTTNGHTLYYGRGAGGAPTASAVISDIIGIGTGVLPALFFHTDHWQDINTKTNQLPAEETEHRYYLRISVSDKAGILAELTGVLTRWEISVASFLQEEISEGTATIIITTHYTKEKQMLIAKKELEQKPFVHSCISLIAILEEFSETLLI